MFSVCSTRPRARRREVELEVARACSTRRWRPARRRRCRGRRARRPGGGCARPSRRRSMRSMPVAVAVTTSLSANSCSARPNRCGIVSGKSCIRPCMSVPPKARTDSDPRLGPKRCAGRRPVRSGAPCRPPIRPPSPSASTVAASRCCSSPSACSSSWPTSARAWRRRSSTTIRSLLITLDARNRHLLLVVAAGIGAVPFFAIGFFRLLISDPLFFLLGRWYGEPATAVARGQGGEGRDEAAAVDRAQVRALRLPARRDHAQQRDLPLRRIVGHAASHVLDAQRARHHRAARLLLVPRQGVARPARRRSSTGSSATSGRCLRSPSASSWCRRSAPRAGARSSRSRRSRTRSRRSPRQPSADRSRPAATTHDETTRRPVGSGPCTGGSRSSRAPAAASARRPRRQLAKEGFDVVIGARRVDRLREVADATGAQGDAPRRRRTTRPSTTSAQRSTSAVCS